MNKTFIDFNTIVESVDRLLSHIKQEDVKYDYVVGFGRGGLIPATLLAYKLDLPVLCFSVASYDGTSQQSTYKIYQEIDFDKLQKDTKILVVDDICDTGDTFMLFKNLNKPNIIKETYVSLFAKEDSKHIIDYYSSITPSNVWLVFPWEVDDV